MENLWQPILPQARAHEAQVVLGAILESLPTPAHLEWGPSLSGGHAGFALLSAYAGLAEVGSIRDTYLERARTHLETAAGMLPFQGNEPGLFMGYVGVAWTVDHLQQRGILPESEDLNEEIDDALIAWLAPEPWRGLPELIEGLAGVGLYGLARPANARSWMIVDRIIDILQATVQATPQGTAWFTAPDQLDSIRRQQHPDGAFNLGVAHGNPGILGFLAEACHRGFQRARPLLDTSMDWLLSCQSPFVDGSIFGRTFGYGQPPNPDGCRLSWCYGDLGIAAVMLLVAARVRQPAWRDEAIKIALACANRPNPWDSVMDASLCHGAAGNAHLFNRFFQATDRKSVV